MNSAHRPKLPLQLILGLLLGGATVALVRVGVRPQPTALAPTFQVKVQEGTVSIPDQSVVPFSFDTAPVELSAPLPPSQVTARVATMESKTAPCYAPLEGRIAEVSVRIGDRVKQGQRLMLVRSGELAALERDMKAAQLSIRTKQALVERLRLLVESRAAPQADLMVAESELNEARLTASAAEAKVRSLGVQSQPDVGYWVLAARSGNIVQLDAQSGKQVGPDRDHPVATIAELDEVLVLADVPQSDITGLQVGATALVRAPGDSGEPITGKVDVISAVVDPERQTVPVRIRVQNTAHRLRAYAFVEASFQATSTERVIIAPAQGVVSDGLTSIVFLVSADGHSYQRRPVKLGRRSSDKVEVLEGLRPGDRIVTRGALLLLNALAGSK